MQLPPFWQGLGAQSSMSAKPWQDKKKYVMEAFGLQFLLLRVYPMLSISVEHPWTMIFDAGSNSNRGTFSNSILFILIFLIAYHRGNDFYQQISNYDKAKPIWPITILAGYFITHMPLSGTVILTLASGVGDLFHYSNLIIEQDIKSPPKFLHKRHLTWSSLDLTLMHLR